MEVDLAYMTFRKYTKLINKEINKSLKDYEMSSQHGNYLIALMQKEKEGMSIKELNAATENDGAITTRVIKTLSQKSLITVVTSGARASIVRLTNAGKSLCKNMLDVMDRLRKEILKNLNRLDVRQLNKIAKKLYFNSDGTADISAGVGE